MYKDTYQTMPLFKFELLFCGILNTQAMNATQKRSQFNFIQGVSITYHPALNVHKQNN